MRPRPRAAAGRLIAAAAAALALLAATPVARAAPQESLVEARYTGPVERYGHFAAGRPHEYARIEATTTAGRTLILALPTDQVFEDIAPRKVRLTADGPDFLLAIVSRQRQGAALALIGIEHGRLDLLARSDPIGTAMRWLNPVGVADLDNDGIAEIAAVITPHLGGPLKLYHRRGPRLEEIAALGGFSNHVYGTPELSLSAVLTHGPRRLLAVPDTARRTLRLIAYDDGRLYESARCQLPAPLTGAVIEHADGSVQIRNADGEIALKPEICRR